MKRLIYLLSIMIAFTLTTTQGMAQNSGFYLGGSLQAAYWTMPDFDMDAESGGGFGIKAGYAINPNIGLFLGLDGATIEPEVGEDYGLGHFDLGVEGRIAVSGSKFWPYARVSYLGMAAVQDDPSGDVEISGAGYGLGAGFYYFFTSQMALDVSFTKSWVNITDIKIGSNSVTVDEDAETGRLMLGLSYYF